MSDKPVNEMTQLERDELCCTYAALILHDDGLEITSEKISKLIKDSGNTVEPATPILFAKSVKSLNI